MTTKRIKTIASICLISGLSFTKANAAIIVVAPTAASAGSIQITQDISFTINTESTILAFGFVFDEWVTSDGSQTISALPNYLSNNLKLKGTSEKRLLSAVSDSKTAFQI